MRECVRMGRMGRRRRGASEGEKRESASKERPNWRARGWGWGWFRASVDGLCSVHGVSAGLDWKGNTEALRKRKEGRIFRRPTLWVGYPAREGVKGRE